MKIFGFVLSLLHNATRKVLRAGYDAAKTTVSNARHWLNADGYSANLANDPYTRRTIAKRALYERMNNCYCAGLVTTKTADMVGTGPRRVTRNPEIAKKWHQWCRKRGIVDTLRVLDETKTVKGECFAVFGSNPNLPEDEPQLVIQLIEPERVQGDYNTLPQNNTDGITLDIYGNPISYRILDEHPEDSYGGLGKATTVAAKDVIHWFRPNRPEQARGISELVAALPLFAQLRRYTLAVLMAAETAARICGVLHTDEPIGDDDPEEPELYDQVPLPEGGALLTVPKGWKPEQMKAEQPTGTYKEFKAELICEIGRSIPAPFNVVAGNSSGYNFSSGRLDFLPYHRMLRIERMRFETIVLDRIYLAWYEEARRIPGYLPLHNATEAEGGWFFDGFASIDPENDAKTDTLRLENNTTNLTEIYANYGQDLREQLEIRAQELALLDELGLSKNNIDPNGVEKTALNGAQVTSIVTITTAIASGQMPIESARAVLIAAFPGVDPATIDEIVNPFKDFKPENQNAA